MLAVVLASALGQCSDVVGYTQRQVAGFNDVQASCAAGGADNGWNYDAAIAAGTYDSSGAGMDLDGEPECSVADERYISDCTGMPVSLLLLKHVCPNVSALPAPS